MFILLLLLFFQRVRTKLMWEQIIPPAGRPIRGGQ